MGIWRSAHGSKTATRVFREAVGAACARRPKSMTGAHRLRARLGDVCGLAGLGGVLLLCLMLWPLAALPQQADRPYLIGTREAPPFAMKSAVDGRWEGISIDLLEELAGAIGFRYELREVSLPEMIDGVAAGRLDGSIAAMTITAEREQRVDFSHTFFRTGLGVAVPATQHAGWLAILDVLTSRAFLGTISLLATLLLTVGFLIWVLERKRNSAQFERPPARGLFSGVWWAAVTMSTVGYGDKTPVTLLGRSLAMLWMFLALILTAVFTAQMTAGLTSTQINSPVQTINDLPRVRVGNVANSASLQPLGTIGVRPIAFGSVTEGLQALADHRIEAFVHDASVLKWETGSVNGVQITPLQFAPQDYGIVLPQGTDRREELNRVLLSILSSSRWTDIQRRYLGE